MTSPETSRAALADELQLLINEYDPNNSDWGFRKGVISELIIALRAPPAVEGGATKAHQAAQDNLREAWSALAMIRETIETLAPSGSVKAAEHLDGPTFMHEADALVLGIRALSQPQIEGGAVREALEHRQRIIFEWGSRCFGIEHMLDAIVRAARFFEEAAELAQSSGLPKDHAQRAFDHVYSRPAGEPAQEVGGVANTLMALCGTLGLSFDDCQRAEIERCLAKDPSHFAERNEAKLREVDAAPPQTGDGQ